MRHLLAVQLAEALADAVVHLPDGLLPERRHCLGPREHLREPEQLVQHLDDDRQTEREREEGTMRPEEAFKKL